MASENSKIDQNRDKSLTGVTDDSNAEIRNLLVDATTGRLKVSAVISSSLNSLNDVTITGTPADNSILTYDTATSQWTNQTAAEAGISGTGTVTSVSVTTANGVSGSVATATTTPAITLTLGAITPSTVNGLTLTALATGFTIAGGTASKTLTVPLDASVSGTNTGDNAANSSSHFIGTTSVALNRASAPLTLAGITLTTPDIGTPSAGNLANCTFPTLNQNTSGTSAGLSGTPSITVATVTTTGNIELGHASDTTVSRSSAGVMAVEGVVIPSISSTNTLTNKRITKRTGTTTSSATPTINTDNVDFYSLTAQAVDITSFTTNLTGTPTEGQTLWIAITGTAARAITWGTSFEASTVALPTTTVTTNRLDVGFIWNTVTSKWRCIATS